MVPGSVPETACQLPYRGNAEFWGDLRCPGVEGGRRLGYPLLEVGWSPPAVGFPEAWNSSIKGSGLALEASFMN